MLTPPYSLNWNPSDHEFDPRFEGYGLAPASKRADFAFLLHCLYHMNSEGIMQIILPHGVLFRGNTEKDIRKNLVEKNNIDTIIGLPANIFANTGIATVILILKKNKNINDNGILFIDASKEFVKEGKINKLEGSYIRKITDAIINRKDIPNFAKYVSKKEIIDNDYNLNISKYVSSTIPEIPYDLYGTVCGGIPNHEINMFDKYWNEFKTLKDELFLEKNKHVSFLKTKEIEDVVTENSYVLNFQKNFHDIFKILEKKLYEVLIENKPTNIYKIKEEIIKLIFDLSSNVNLIDKYQIYNAFDKIWFEIITDLELVSEFGKNVVKEIEEKTILKNGKEKSFYDGKIISYSSIKEELFKDEISNINKMKIELNDIEENILNVLEKIEDEYKENFLKEDSNEINWSEVTSITKNLNKKNCEETSNEFKLLKINNLNKRKKEINKEIKQLENDLSLKAEDKIKNLSIQEIDLLLNKKWVNPIINSINNLSNILIDNFLYELNLLIEKYENPINEIDQRIKKEEKELLSLLKELHADEYATKAINEIIQMLEDE